MRLLFYEPDHTGHHFAYLARMLPGFVELPIDVSIVTTRRALESVEYAKLLAPFGDRLEMIPSAMPAPRKPVANARHRLRELADAIRAARPDHVAVCYADGLWEQAYLAALVGRRPWPRELVVEGWLYRGRFAEANDRRLKSRLRRPMFAGLLRRGLFRKLHLHHELLYDFAKPLSAGTPTEVVLAPDPIVIRPPMTPAEARRELGVPGDGTWIGVAGVIARYKGADLFLEADRLRRERGSEPAVRALLAGPQQEDIRAMLRQSPYREWIEDGSIVSVDRYLTENEMYAAAAAVDLVVAPYPQHQNRSSIILWAAAAGRPCLGSDESCVGHVIRAERLGSTCHVQDPAVLAEAISAALATPWTADDVARVRAYAEFHRMENYQSISSQLVRQRLRVS
jgi:glycosyltransferase involved in cell wall biosynthesis